MSRQPIAACTWRELMVQGLLLLCVLVVLFPAVFVRGEMLFPGDILFATLPWFFHAPAELMGGLEEIRRPQNVVTFDLIRAFNVYYCLTKRALEGGEWPLWNPLENAGMPLLANYQSAPFYPPRLLHAFLDVYLATTIYIVLKLWLCGFTAYLYGRYIRLGAASARLLSVAWMLSGFNAVWCYWPLPDVGAWLPVVMLGVELLLDERYRTGFWTLALGAVLFLLGGHPETALLMGLGAGLYFALRLAWERRRGRRLWVPVGLAGGAWALALLVCAAQLLPFLEYLVNSFTYYARAAGGDDPHGLPVKNLAAFWAPRFFGTDPDRNFWGSRNHNFVGMIYPGILVWIGLALLVSRAETDSTRRARMACLIPPILLGVVLAFDNPLGGILNGLPVFRSAWRCYHMGFAMFALPVLAAIGVEGWFSRARKVRELGWAGGLVVIAGAALAAVYVGQRNAIAEADVGAFVRNQMLLAALFGALGLGALGLYCVAPRRALVGNLLVLVLAADLVVAAHGLYPSMARRYLLVDTDLGRFLDETPRPCRFMLDSAHIPTGPMAVAGVEQWKGFDGMYPMRIMRFQERTDKKQWIAIEPACSIEYYLNNIVANAPWFPLEDRERFTHVGTFDLIEVYRNNRAFPRAYLVAAAQVVDDMDRMFEIMLTPGYDPGKTALVEVPLPSPLPETQPARLGEAHVREHRSTRVVVEADAVQDCVLVLADAYYPGWDVRVDGRRADVFPVYSILRGIVLPAGRHTVEYTYLPLSFRLGLAVSVGALMASLAACLYILYRQSRSLPSSRIPTASSEGPAGPRE